MIADQSGGEKLWQFQSWYIPRIFTALAEAGIFHAAYRRHKCLLHPTPGYSNFGIAIGRFRIHASHQKLRLERAVVIASRREGFAAR
jgi:hypothetical protein